MRLANKWSTILRRRRDLEPEIGAVARENEGEPAPQERQVVETPVEAPAESASANRGSVAADNEERVRLRLGAEGKRGQKHDMQDVLEPQTKTSQNWRNGPRQQFKEAQARVMMFLLVLLWLRA